MPALETARFDLRGFPQFHFRVKLGGQRGDLRLEEGFARIPAEAALRHEPRRRTLAARLATADVIPSRRRSFVLRPDVENGLLLASEYHGSTLKRMIQSGKLYTD